MRFFVFALVVCSMVGCTAFTVGDANKLRRGMTPDAVETLVSKGPRLTVDFEVPSLAGERFTTMVFDLALGTTAADYYAVFRGGKLYYWGHPYEFNRYPDPEMNAIGKAAVEAATK